MSAENPSTEPDANMTPADTIRIAAALMVDDRGRLLLVRKRGTRSFIQPGGKIEPGETALEALCRELQEELGLVVTAAEPTYLGQFSAPAANEAGRSVRADVFRLTIAAVPVPAAEIEEVMWLDPSMPGKMELAPLIRDQMLPLHRSYLADRDQSAS